MTALRQQLADALLPLLPDTYKYVTSERSVDTISAPTVFVRQRSIEPAQSAPGGSHLVTFLVIVVTPEQDIDKAEEALDDHVLNLLAALDYQPQYLWSKAEKTQYEDRNLAYYIDVTVVTRKS